MRITLAAALFLAALSGCNRNGGNEQNGAGGLPIPGARPGTNTSTDLASDQAFRQSYRTINIGTCVNGARSQAAQSGFPAGTDFRPYCTCFIDRSMVGLSVEQLSRLTPGAREDAIAEQCALEHGLRGDAGGAPVTPPGSEPADEPGDDGGDSGGTGGK